MSNKIIQSNEVQLAIQLKLNQFRRNDLKTVSYEHVKEVLHFIKWNNQPPLCIHQAIDDVIDLSIGDVIATLHTLALIKATQLNNDQIDDFWRDINE